MTNFNQKLNKTNNQAITETEPTGNKLARRQFVKLLGGASLVLWQNSALSALMKESGVTNAAVNNKKIVWVVLRGALDSIHTIVPSFDPQLKIVRPKLSTSYKKELLPLSDGFALHPSLKNLHLWFQNKQLTPIAAVGTGYGERSHFDGQDFLESGKTTIDHNSGWLARAIDIKHKQAIAIAHSMPISLRSSNMVKTWYPSNLKESSDDIYQQLANLYKDDPALLEHLNQGLKVKEIAEMDSQEKQKGSFKELASACAKLLTAENGVDCAMLEIGGWDTHNNQATRLERKLTELDEGLAELKTGLANAWQDTVVIVATEFGRTVHENGTDGTDHGTGSALFIAGGAVKGGNVMGKWPGLAKAQLFKERDLLPTTNSFSWFANILEHHWQFTQSEILQVFPHIELYKNKLV